MRTVLLTTLQTLLLRMLPRVVTTLLLTVSPRRCQPEKTCFYGGDMACRGGVRTFAAACLAGGSSLVCLLGALAAAPGSVAMLAHRRMAFRAVLARWRFRFQAGLEFFPFAWSHHFYVGDVRSA